MQATHRVLLCVMTRNPLNEPTALYDPLRSNKLHESTRGNKPDNPKCGSVIILPAWATIAVPTLSKWIPNSGLRGSGRTWLDEETCNEGCKSNATGMLHYSESTCPARIATIHEKFSKAQEGLLCLLFFRLRPLPSTVLRPWLRLLSTHCKCFGPQTPSEHMMHAF